MKTTAFMIVAFAGVAMFACAKETDGGAAPASTETAGAATATPQTTTQAASTRATAASPAAVVPASSAAPVVETWAALPPPAVLDAVAAARTRLDGLAAGVDGARVRFVDCAMAGACSARVEAATLGGLRDLLQSMSADQGGIGFEVREQLDAYAGRSFVADVTLGAASARAVPADPAALLGLAEGS